MVTPDERKDGPADPHILTLGSPSSVLGFTRAPGGNWPQWDRFLTLDGKPAYHLGNVCNTCEFFFKRLSGATHSLSAEQLGAALADSQPPMERSWIEALGALLPAGDYVPFYARLPVKLVRPGAPEDYFADEQASTWGVDAFWRLPHDPRTEYYRGRLVVEHWCLAHYLLDGHHKTYTAAVKGTPIGILSFLAVSESIAEPEQALDVVRQLAGQVVA